MPAKWLAVMTVLSLVPVLGAAGGMQGSLQVGFIYVGPVGDYGWTYAHDQGRKYLEKALPDVKTTRPPKARPQTVSSTSAPTSLPR
jgi:basic membrane protein A and related proteins